MKRFKNEKLNIGFEKIEKEFEDLDLMLSDLRNSDLPINKLLYQELLEDFSEYLELFISNLSDLKAGYNHRISIAKDEDKK